MWMVELIREKKNIILDIPCVFVSASVYEIKKKYSENRKFIRLCQSSKDLWHSKKKKYKKYFLCIQFMEHEIGMKVCWLLLACLLLMNKKRKEMLMKKNSRNLIEKFSMWCSFLWMGEMLGWGMKVSFWIWWDE